MPARSVLQVFSKLKALNFYPNGPAVCFQPPKPLVRSQLLTFQTAPYSFSCNRQADETHRAIHYSILTTPTPRVLANAIRLLSP